MDDRLDAREQRPGLAASVIADIEQPHRPLAEDPAVDVTATEHDEIAMTRVNRDSCEDGRDRRGGPSRNCMNTSPKVSNAPVTPTPALRRCESSTIPSTSRADSGAANLLTYLIRVSIAGTHIVVHADSLRLACEPPTSITHDGSACAHANGWHHYVGGRSMDALGRSDPRQLAERLSQRTLAIPAGRHICAQRRMDCRARITDACARHR